MIVKIWEGVKSLLPDFPERKIMAEEKEDSPQRFPRTIELRDTQITCPTCGTKIVVDLDIDVSFISDIAKSFQEINIPNEESESNDER